ncbi:uncharacterized protein LOC114515684 [Dendronephthya gigantea]|uniref:uncharacterized protein LOC114515684 n=1 Tax=Dendronephthya gigantea TaxID=151771 RepID=UPI00106DA355|nr:uncharacterized protein LOC114515684 [Dendronephthya gigantea]
MMRASGAIGILFCYLYAVKSNMAANVEIQAFAAIEDKSYFDDFDLEDEDMSSFLRVVDDVEENYRRNPQNYTLFSGGAVGSDLYWQKIGAKFGIQTKAFSFEGHGSGNNSARVILFQQQLQQADAFLHKANKTLKRNFPTSKTFVDNLLRRNWYQVKDTSAVFGVGRICYRRSIVEGGTGWAVQMAIDSKKPVYVFDVLNSTWQQFDYRKNRFLVCEVPRLALKFTGIGTRSLTENGRKAIKDVFENTFGKSYCQ